VQRDSASDEVYCGPGDDHVVYLGAQDPADTLRSCETVVELPAR
jgi:hypothetical protein